MPRWLAAVRLAHVGAMAIVGAVGVVGVSPSRSVRHAAAGEVLEVVTSFGKERYRVRSGRGHERACRVCRGPRTGEVCAAQPAAAGSGDGSGEAMTCVMGTPAAARPIR